MFLAVTCVAVLAIVSGLLGNGCTVFLVLRHRSLWKWPNAFHVSLSFADTIALFTVLPGLLVLTWPGEVSVTDRRVGCALLAFSGIACNVISIVQLTEISVLRLVRIVRPKYRTPEWIYATCLVCPWIIGLSSALVAFRTSFVLTATPVACLLVNQHWMRHPLLYIIITITFCSVIIVSSAYALIVLHLWQLFNHRVQPGPSPRPSSTLSRSTPALRRNQEASVVSMVIVGLFALSYLPCATLLTIHMTHNTVPTEEALMATVLCAHLNSVWNPYVYILRKRTFRNKFIRTLRKLTCTTE